MAGNKDYIILCLDVGPSMDFAPLGEGDTHLEMALRVASQIVQQKLFAGSKDFVGLVLFGTPDTDNDLASSQGGYDNISVAWQPAQPTLELLQYLHNQIQPGDTSADFLDALVVTMDLMVKVTENAKRVGDRKIYLLTDAGSEYSDDGLGQICAGLREKNIELIVVGPDLEDRDVGAGDGDDRGGGDGGGRGGGGGGGGGGRPPGDSSRMKKSAQQLAGERVLSRAVQEVEGVSFSFREALQVATFIRKTAKRQTTRFAGHLEIGEELKIPCKIFTRTMVERPASWKKLSAISQASAHPGSMAVRMQRSYHLTDEDETEVEMENVAKGYRYGKSLVPISDADEQAMKLAVPRCLSLLGFTHGENIKQHQLVGSSVQVVMPTPGDEHAGTAMSAFIHALYETNMVGVVRYVWRNNAQPKLMVLVPHIKAEYECLMMFQLPYMEDVRQYTFNSLPGSKRQFQPTDEQLTLVNDLISSMDLMTADVDEDGDHCEALHPKRTCNPLIQRTFQCIKHRALNPDQALPEVEANLATMVRPSEPMLAHCSGHLQRVKDSFPLAKVVKKAKDQGEAAAVWKQTSDLDLDAEAPPAKKPRTGEEEADFSMASLARGEVTEVGTLDPVSDYRTLIGRKDIDNFDDASKQLQQVVLKLVKESFGDTYYGKAMDCVKALREEAVRHSETEMFNSFLRELKNDLIGTRYSPFWDKVVSEEVTLISSSECSDSSVTQDEAKQFISTEATAPAATPPDEEPDDADDLLAMM